jgi:arginine decarboxylase
VNYDTDKLLASLEQHCRQAHLSDGEQETFIGLVREGLAGYTYLE